MSVETPLPESRPFTYPQPEPIVGWQRAMLVFTGLILVALLVTAAMLPPSASGMGTHQQLGLPPCSSVMIFGMRCPACGMTTSWAHLMRGQVLQAAHANTGGLLLAMFAIVGGPWMLASAAVGRWWLGMLHPGWVLGVGGLIFTVTTAQWLWRMLL
jgi:hypothetical protein